MEDISPIYDQVDLKEWAIAIRKMKIRELENIILEKKKLLINYHPTLFCFQVQLNNLQNKLDILYEKENEIT